MQTNSNTESSSVDQAAYSFQQGLKLARSMMGHKAISRKGMARVLDAVLEFPLGDENPRFMEKAEEQLFILTLQVIGAKSQMMEAVIASKEQTKPEGENNG